LNSLSPIRVDGRLNGGGRNFELQGQAGGAGIKEIRIFRLMILHIVVILLISKENQVDLDSKYSK